MSTSNAPVKIVVGVDFGTTFSGFAYAHTSDIEKVLTFYDWPSQTAAGGMPYCKTQTSLWYMPTAKLGSSFEVRDWGWPAYVNHLKALQSRNSKRVIETIAPFDLDPSVVALDSIPASPDCGYFITNFKLLLAGSNAPSARKLPAGLSVERVVKDYLLELSKFVMAELRNRYGNHLRKKEIQWCITVPAIWDDSAKQTMKKCAEMAGLVQGPLCAEDDASVHPVIIVLEPEAASVYCQKSTIGSELSAGRKFLVVDVGGGTVDLVLHEKVSARGLKVREVSRSSGGLCGGTYVDQAFFNFLAYKIPCLRHFTHKFPAALLSIKAWWEGQKRTYDGSSDSVTLEIPAKLAAAWKTDSTAKGATEDDTFDELEIRGHEMRGIFHTVVGQILQLIEDRFIPGLHSIMVVGGFSSSPYLMRKIREKFSRRVQQVTSPPDPGSAVCCGAVAFGANPDLVMTRISRRTYGISVGRDFQSSHHKMEYRYVDSEGVAKCDNVFCIFIRNGDEVPVDHLVKQFFTPVNRNDEEDRIILFSTTDLEPKYVTDSGVTSEGSFTMRIPKQAWRDNAWPNYEVTMHFGRTCIEVSAVGKNFHHDEEFRLAPITFQKSFS